MEPEFTLHCSALFLSTPSARRATLISLSIVMAAEIFLSTPSARRATLHDHTLDPLAGFLSTPSARRATRTTAHPFSPAMDFYPRPPRGGRHQLRLGCIVGDQFLSTPSARRATITRRTLRNRDSISIHALREEGDVRGRGNVKNSVISIHALREEGDTPKIIYEHGKIRFLSTPSARRATSTVCPKSIII